MRVHIHSEAEATFGNPTAQAAYGVMGKAAQTRIWTGFLDRAVEFSGGRQVGSHTLNYTER